MNELDLTKFGNFIKLEVDATDRIFTLHYSNDNRVMLGSPEAKVISWNMDDVGMTTDAGIGQYVYNFLEKKYMQNNPAYNYSRELKNGRLTINSIGVQFGTPSEEFDSIEYKNEEKKERKAINEYLDTLKPISERTKLSDWPKSIIQYVDCENKISWAFLEYNSRTKLYKKVEDEDGYPRLVYKPWLKKYKKRRKRELLYNSSIRDKIVIDGKVAVLYSNERGVYMPKYCNRFNPESIKRVQEYKDSKDHNINETEEVEGTYISSLDIAWIPEGTMFKVVISDAVGELIVRKKDLNMVA